MNTKMCVGEMSQRNPLFCTLFGLCKSPALQLSLPSNSLYLSQKGGGGYSVCGKEDTGGRLRADGVTESGSDTHQSAHTCTYMCMHLKTHAHTQRKKLGVAGTHL